MSGSHPWIWGPIEGMQGLRLPPPPPSSGPLGVCTGPNSQFYKRKNPNKKPTYIFCLSLSNREGRLPRKPAHRSSTIALKLREKGLSKEVLESHRFTRLSNL